MKNPAVRIRTYAYKQATLKSMTETEQRFCDLILDGRTHYEAGIESGYISKDDDRQKALNKCSNFVRTKKARRYLSDNARTVKLITEKDYDVVRTHMYEIAMGLAVRKSMKVDNEGNEHEIEEGPSFRDQIAAAGWLSSDLKERRNQLERTPAQEIIINDMEEIEKKASALVGKYSYRPIRPEKNMIIESQQEKVIDVECVEDGIPDGRYNTPTVTEAFRKEMDEYSL